jgi:rod shape-determining protein MreD
MSGLERSGIVTSGRPEELLRGALPFVSVLLLVCIDLAPLPSAAPTAIAPLLCLCGIFYWTIQRPDLFGNSLVLVAMIVLDATAGLPLGLTAAALFATRLLLLTPPRFFAGRSFLVTWACFSLAVTVLMTLRWLLASLYFQHVFTFRPVAFELLLTIAAYPLVSLLMAYLHPHLPKVAHAAPRG